MLMYFDTFYIFRIMEDVIIQFRLYLRSGCGWGDNVGALCSDIFSSGMRCVPNSPHYATVFYRKANASLPACITEF